MISNLTTNIKAICDIKGNLKKNQTGKAKGFRQT